MHSVNEKSPNISSKVVLAYYKAADVLSACIFRVPRLRVNDTPEDNAMIAEIP
jgi:hypothetical protein